MSHEYVGTGLEVQRNWGDHANWRSTAIHPWHELLLVIGGRYAARSEDLDTEVGVGQAIYWPAGHAHAGRFIDGRHTHFFLLMWPADFPEILAPQATTIADPHARMAMALEWMWSHGSASSELEQGTLQALWTAIMGEARRARGVAPPGGAADGDDHRLRTVVQAMERVGHKDVSIGHLATMVGLSRNHLTRLFKERYGCPPKAYLQQRRCEHATRLLRTTDWDLDRIAVAVGLGSASHLVHVYRHYTGHTPGAVRRGA